MNSAALRLALVAAILAFTAPGHAQLTIRDDIGRPLVLKAPAKRIVTLSPTLTEIAYAAGAGDLVVGVDSLSDFPPEAKRVAQVATGAQFSFDQLAALKPDLVLAWSDGIRPDDVEKMTTFGAIVFVAQARSLSDVPRLLEAIGQLTARSTAGAIADFEARLDRVTRANAGKPRVSAFLEIWNRPLTTVSGRHIMSEALAICRAENVFRDLPGSAPKVSWEQVAMENPQIIVGLGSASNAEEFRSNWNLRRGLDAVVDNRLLWLEASLAERPTPRAPEGIAQLCESVDQVRTARGNVAAAPVTVPASSSTPSRADPFAPAASAYVPNFRLNPPAGSAEAPATQVSTGSTSAAVGSGTNPALRAPTETKPAAAVPQVPARPSQYGL